MPSVRPHAMFWGVLCAGLLFFGCPDDGPGDGDPTGDKPVSLPEIRLFAEGSPLNTRIPVEAELDPDSSRYVADIAASAPQVLVQAKQFSAPVYFADSLTPRHDVELTCGPVWEVGVSTLADVPIPDYAEPGNDVDGADSPVVGCGEDSAQDNNMVLIDLDARCEYDLWQARKVSGRWVASWGNALSIDGLGVYEGGLSARGSGFAFLAGVIWPHELRNGEIPHALLFALPDDLVRGGGPVPPATESDGISTHPDALPEGAHLRLDPTLDLDTLGLTPTERTIARALQEYGMFLTDRGDSASLVFYAVDPRSVRDNPYEGLLPDVDYPELENLPLDRLQVLKLPPQTSDFQDHLALPTGGCAAFE